MKNKGLLFIGLILLGIGFWGVLLWCSVPLQLWVYGFLRDALNGLEEYITVSAAALAGYVAGWISRELFDEK